MVDNWVVSLNWALQFSILVAANKYIKISSIELILIKILSSEIVKIISFKFFISFIGRIIP